MFLIKINKKINKHSKVVYMLKKQEITKKPMNQMKLIKSLRKNGWP